jgi:hypothetical protein
MGASKPHASDTLARLASGIEAGVIGGLAVLGVLVSESLLRGHAWWEIPNLLGTTFYGSRAFRTGPSLVTLSGTALHFTLTGTIGGIFGVVFGAIRERWRLVPLGLATAMIWYLLADAVFWLRVNPLVPLYENSLHAFQPVAILSQAIFGACLGWMGPADRHPATEELQPSELPSGELASELPSGELALSEPPLENPEDISTEAN